MRTPPPFLGDDALLHDSGEHAANLQDRRPRHFFPPAGLLVPHAHLASDREFVLPAELLVPITESEGKSLCGARIT